MCVRSILGHQILYKFQIVVDSTYCINMVSKPNDPDATATAAHWGYHCPLVGLWAVIFSRLQGLVSIKAAANVNLESHGVTGDEFKIGLDDRQPNSVSTHLVIESGAAGIAPLFVHTGNKSPLVGFWHVVLCSSQSYMSVIAP